MISGRICLSSRTTSFGSRPMTGIRTTGQVIARRSARTPLPAEGSHRLGGRKERNSWSHEQNGQRNLTDTLAIPPSVGFCFGLAFRGGKRGSVMRLGGVLFAVALVLNSGCSIFFVRAPLNEAKDEQPLTAVQRKNDCTESNVAPALDVTAATGLTVWGSLFAYLAACGRQCEIGNTGGAVAMSVASFVSAALLVASAAHGFSTTAQCRALGPVPLPRTDAPGAISLRACVQTGDAPTRCLQPVPFTTAR
jgi:hypothetical protein